MADMLTALAAIVEKAIAGKVSYNRKEAAAATGYHPDTIKLACMSKRLVEHFPFIDGKPTTKGTILATDLAAWIAAGPTDRDLT